MLIFNSSDGIHNIIQLVMGPESQVQLDMSGCIKIDLEGLLENFDNDLPYKLFLTRSNNEAQTLSMLGVNVKFDNTPKYINTNETPTNNDIVDETNYNDDDDYYKVHPFGEYVKEIICPKCNEYGVFLKEDQPACCGDCLKIEKGLGNIPVKNNDEPDSKDDKKK